MKEGIVSSLPGGIDPLAPAAAQLFRYLEAVQRLQNRIIRDSAAYSSRDGWVKDFHRLPAHPGIKVADPADGATPVGRVMTVERIPQRDVPLPPHHLLNEIVGDLTDPSEQPRLRDPFLNGLRPSAQDQSEFAQWSDEWWRWSQEELPGYEVRKLYTDLFHCREILSTASQSFELVLGVGRLRSPRGVEKLDRHIVTLPVRISLDAGTGAVTVDLTEDGSPSVEMEMLEADEIRHAAARTEFEAEIENLDTSIPLDVDVWEPVLQRFINNAMPNGRYERGESNGQSDVYELSLSPALILRPRSKDALLRALKTIAESLQDCPQLPVGIRALVDPDAVRQVESKDVPGSNGAARIIDDEVFLPMPVNSEQLQVLARADSRALTLVQGPPGTGKTHTTAVLISHFLAQGLRVLVTAQSQQALREVRSKLPDSIQDLAVSVLGGSRKEMTHLRASISAISQRAEGFNDAVNQQSIDEALAELDSLAIQRAGLRAQLVEAGANEAEPQATPFGKDSFANIARWVVEEEQKFPWAAWLLPEASPEVAPPDPAEIARYRESVMWSKDAWELAEVPRLGSSAILLPDAAAVKQLLDRRQVAADACVANVAVMPELSAALESRDALDQLKERLELLSGLSSRLSQRPEAWVQDAMADVSIGKISQWTSRQEKVTESLTNARTLLADAGTCGPISVDDSSQELRPLVTQLVDYTRNNSLKVDARGQVKSGLLAGKVVRAAKEVFAKVRVAGHPPTTRDELLAVQAHFNLIDVVEYLDRIWPAGTPVSTEETLEERIAWHTDESGILADVLTLLPPVEAVTEFLRTVHLPTPSVSDHEALQQLLEQVRTIERTQKLDELDSRIKQLATGVQPPGVTSGIFSELARALVDRDYEKFLLARTKAEQVLAAQSRMQEQEKLHNKIVVIAPSLVSAIQKDPDSADWVQRIEETPAAWRVNAARQWIDTRKRFDPNQVQDHIAELDCQIRDRVADIAGRRAWSAAVGRLTAGKRADLENYAQLVRRYGKGTGKRARELEVEIRRALANCRDAVPVWIMPLYQVAESQEITMGAFDVVVVDEASQAGLDALFLQYLAPKMVVVGDDKQVSPSAVGVDTDKIAALAQQFLANNRYRAAFQDARRSLFDEAKMRYPDLITLREHRRCVPGVIEFSNQIAYASEGRPLIPVRESGSSALPPVVPHFCPDGQRSGSSSNALNEIEADFVVASIRDMLNNPEYDGKSIGVISLLGPKQAQLIERKLIEVVPTEELIARDIRCGDSASFQGSERDVILLSMVASVGERAPTALTADVYVQRYNVAASRAKDQMLLFYSVPRTALRNTEDMRYQLVSYFEDAADRERAAMADVQQVVVRDDVVVDPFSSRFEQQICNELVERSYMVIPRYEALGHKLDLVVVGESGKLAVECDGDNWPGEESFERQMAAQRELERCGWSFHRIPESDYVLDPITTIQNLITTLNDHGIQPDLGKKNDDEGDPAPDDEAAHAGAANQQTANDWSEANASDTTVAPAPETTIDGSPESGDSGSLDDLSDLPAPTLGTGSELATQPSDTNSQIEAGAEESAVSEAVEVPSAESVSRADDKDDLAVDAPDLADEVGGSDDQLPPQPESQDPAHLHDLAVLAYDSGDLELARNLWTQALQGGQAQAGYSLGLLALKDNDRASAIGWLSQAADLGDAQAMYRLGWLLQEAGDRDSARRMWLKAAKQDIPEAMYALGWLLYESGESDRSRLWLTRAASAGYTEAEEALRKLQ
jgi:TPR repeat protein